jgi:hypothetical protein
MLGEFLKSRSGSSCFIDGMPEAQTQLSCGFRSTETTEKGSGWVAAATARGFAFSLRGVRPQHAHSSKYR